MPAQKLNRNWVSWHWGAVFLTLLPAVLFMMTFVSPKGPQWWVWFVDAAPDWLMWIVRALLVGWAAAAWKFQTRPLLQDLRRRRELTEPPQQVDAVGPAPCSSGSGR
jgi:hypothetical protein